MAGSATYTLSLHVSPVCTSARCQEGSTIQSPFVPKPKPSCSLCPTSLQCEMYQYARATAHPDYTRQEDRCSSAACYCYHIWLYCYSFRIEPCSTPQELKRDCLLNELRPKHSIGESTVFQSVCAIVEVHEGAPAFGE